MAIADIVRKLIADSNGIAGKIIAIDEQSSSFAYYGIGIPGALKSEAKWVIYRIYRQGTVYTIEQAPNQNYTNIWDNRTTYFSSLPLNNSYSVFFDGVNDRVFCGDNYTFGPAIAFSISFWCNPNNIASTRCLISKCSDDASVIGYNIEQIATTGKIQLQMRTSGGTYPIYQFSNVLTPGVWQHVVLTFDGGSNINGARCYLDSVIGDTPGSSNLSGNFNNTANFTIGSRNSVFPYSGYIDEVSVFDKELNQTEVTELYNGGQPSDLSDFSAYNNLLSWWRMGDNDTYPIILDQKGSANGTMTNQTSNDIVGEVP